MKINRENYFVSNSTIGNQVSKNVDFIFVLLTVFWGSGFVVVKALLSSIPAVWVVALRFLIAFVVVSIFVLFQAKLKSVNIKVVTYGMILGIVVCASFLVQAVGIQLTTASKASFINSLTIVFVPLFSILILHLKPSKITWISVFLSLIGVACLSLDYHEGLTLNFGDMWVLLAALIGAFNLILISIFTPKVDSFLLTWIQLGTVGVISSFIGFISGEPLFLGGSVELPYLILYLGIVPTALTTVLQLSNQKHTTPTRVALITNLTPVFASLFSYMFLRERFTVKFVVGSSLVFCAVFLLILSDKKQIEVNPILETK